MWRFVAGTQPRPNPLALPPPATRSGASGASRASETQSAAEAELNYASQWSVTLFRTAFVFTAFVSTALQRRPSPSCALTEVCIQVSSHWGEPCCGAVVH